MADTNDIMSNEDIMNSFEELFASASDDDTDDIENQIDDDEEETNTDNDSNEDNDSDEDTDDSSTDDEDSDENQEEDKSSESDKKTTSKSKQDAGSKQNFAFAQMRQRNKELETSLKSLGKLIGMKDAKVPDIEARLKEVLLEKESKDSGVPKDILERLDRAEGLLAENDRIKRENTVQNELATLFEKYNPPEEKATEFIQHLIKSDKNPVADANVDIEGEFLKFYQADLIEAAVKAALDKESKRTDKVNNQSTSTVPGGSKDTGNDEKIDSPDKLDAFLASQIPK